MRVGLVVVHAASVGMHGAMVVSHGGTVVLRGATVVMCGAACAVHLCTGKMAAGTAVMQRSCSLSPLPAGVTWKRLGVCRAGTQETAVAARLVPILLLVLPRLTSQTALRPHAAPGGGAGDEGGDQLRELGELQGFGRIDGRGVAALVAEEPAQRPELKLSSFEDDGATFRGGVGLQARPEDLCLIFRSGLS
jgi:hypothetical protein